MNQIMICAPADTPFTEAGSTFKHVCSECTRRVQVSPAGEALRRERNGEIRIICDECFTPAHEAMGIACPFNLGRRVPNYWRHRN